MVYTMSALYATNIHNLRIIARKVGVSRPTTLPKNELIDEILNIQNGLKSPIPVSKRGRPLKHPVDSENDTDFFISRSLTDNSKVIKTQVLEQQSIEKRAKQELLDAILKRLNEDLLFTILRVIDEEVSKLM